MQKSDFYKRKMQLSKLALLTSLEKSGRVGFIKRKGEIRVPENFNDLNNEEIEDLFYGKDLSTPKATRCQTYANGDIQEKRK